MQRTPRRGKRQRRAARRERAKRSGAQSRPWSRPEGSREDAVGDFAHAAALAHRSALDEGERLLLTHSALVHQHSLRALDRLARLELLAERIDLAAQHLQLAEPSDRDLDRRDEVALLERLEEV